MRLLLFIVAAAVASAAVAAAVADCIAGTIATSTTTDARPGSANMPQLRPCGTSRFR